MVARDVREGTSAPPAATVARAGGDLRIAFLSRITPMKNLLGAVEILSEVEAPITFDVYGPVEDVRYWEACRRSLAALPKNVRAAYHGPVPHGEVGGVLSRYDLFLLPTLGESFGHAIADALGAGCPPLISDRTPWRELEAEGVGWALPLSDIAAFRRVIAACAAEPPAVRRERAARARAWSVASPSDAEALEANRRLLTQLTGGPVYPRAS